jgi:hypothetical protein
VTLDNPLLNPQSALPKLRVTSALANPYQAGQLSTKQGGLALMSKAPVAYLGIS